MTARGYTQTFLAKEKLGFATPSGVSERYRGKQSMRVDTFVKFLKAMDFGSLWYESKTSSKEEWTEVNFE